LAPEINALGCVLNNFRYEQDGSLGFSSFDKEKHPSMSMFISQYIDQSGGFLKTLIVPEQNNVERPALRVLTENIFCY
jgi:hypothetical protein